MVQLGSALAIFILIIAAIFALGFVIVRYVNSEKQRILKAYRNGNLYPLLRYAKKHPAFSSCDATAEEGLDIIFLIELQRLKHMIPKEYETLDQKKAWLMTKYYNHCYLRQHDLVRYEQYLHAKSYKSFPDGALQEMLNSETLMESFASEYYNREREDVGIYSCIHTFARDGSELAKEIIEKAQSLWDAQHESKNK